MFLLINHPHPNYHVPNIALAAKWCALEPPLAPSGPSNDPLVCECTSNDDYARLTIGPDKQWRALKVLAALRRQIHTFLAVFEYVPWQGLIATGGAG